MTITTEQKYTFIGHLNCIKEFFTAPPEYHLTNISPLLSQIDELPCSCSPPPVTISVQEYILHLIRTAEMFQANTYCVSAIPFFAMGLATDPKNPEIAGSKYAYELMSKLASHFGYNKLQTDAIATLISKIVRYSDFRSSGLSTNIKDIKTWLYKVGKSNYLSVLDFMRIRTVISGSKEDIIQLDNIINIITDPNIFGLQYIFKEDLLISNQDLSISPSLWRRTVAPFLIEHINRHCCHNKPNELLKAARSFIKVRKDPTLGGGFTDIHAKVVYDSNKIHI